MQAMDWATLCKRSNLKLQKAAFSAVIRTLAQDNDGHLYERLAAPPEQGVQEAPAALGVARRRTSCGVIVDEALPAGGQEGVGIFHARGRRCRGRGARRGGVLEDFSHGPPPDVEREGRREGRQADRGRLGHATERYASRLHS